MQNGGVAFDRYRVVINTPQDPHHSHFNNALTKTWRNQ
jgi:hypothetical protein